MKPRIKTILALAVMSMAIYPSVRLVGPRGEESSAVTASTGLSQLWGKSDRRTADGLLKRARKALDENKLELAEWYLQRIEKLDVDYTGGFSGKDTPASLRAELAKLQAKQSVSEAAPSDRFQPQTIDGDTAVSAGQVVGNPQRAGEPLTSDMDQMLDTLVSSEGSLAKTYMKKARSALQAGNLTAAVGHYHSALRTGDALRDPSDSPQQLAAALVAAGVDPQLLRPNAAPADRVSADIGGGADLGEVPSNSELAVVDPQLADVATSAVPRATGALPEYAATPYTAPPGLEGRAPEAAEKSRVVGLLAMARAALDRGDVLAAENFAIQARSFQLPDHMFAPGETRPEMLLLEVNRHKARLASAADHVAQTGHSQPLDDSGYAGADVASAFDPLEELPPRQAIRAGQVAAIGGANEQAGGAVLAQGGLLRRDPREASGLADPALVDRTPPGVVSSEPVAGIARPAQLEVPLDGGSADEFGFGSDAGLAENDDPTLIAPPTASGLDASAISGAPAGSAFEFYEQGMAALKQHDVPEARRLFKQAWAQRDTLDEVTRQRLQDHLQSLSGPPSAPAEVTLGGEQPGDPLDAVDQQEVRRLLEEVTREQAAIRRLRESRPTEAWERTKQLRETIAQANVGGEAQQRLLARVDRGMKELEAYIAQNKPIIELDERNRSLLEEIERRREQRLRTQQKLAELVEEFNELMDQQRFPEAMVIAKQARELDPENAVTQNLVWKSQVAREIALNIRRNERFQINYLGALEDVADSAEPFPDNMVTQFPKDWAEFSEGRLNRARTERSRFSESELQIQQALQQPVDLNFENESLASALDQLGRMAGINIFLDPEGLEAERVSSDTTISLPLRKPVSLKSALNLILQPLHLSYVIQDEVLRITSEQVRNGDVYTKSYYVADLVLAIPNFSPSYNMGLPGAIRDGFQTAGYAAPVGSVVQSPLTIAAGNQGVAAPPQGASALAQLGQSGMLPMGGGGASQPLGFGPGGPGGGTQADFDTLIQLIESTVEPDTWEALGGTGNMRGFPTNLSLVVSQTQEVHEKIADLLDQLRRLQDLQVTIEVRFITLSDDFFERIGVDFDFDIDDNSGLLQGDITQIDDDGPSVTIGIDPVTRTPRADLDIGFTQGSFGSTIPTFGGYDPNTAANVGFAILSDLEAFFLIEAVQGDTRTNILQAPKVTLFNGQQAFVSDTSQRPFVTSVIPVVGDFAAAHQPVITVLTEGTSLSVQAVVSQDRRFVRLTLVPFFSRIGEVDTFTFNGRTDSDTGTTELDPTDDTNTVQDNRRTITEGTTVQLPTFAFTTVNTTVSVPDGGTILLGGIKRLSEGRNERGVPILSKLPYVNRLFTNVGIGRETSSLMMMVTPRIIIQEEEEELQTGYRAP